MKMGKVAKMIGVDRATVFNWIERPELKHLFSDDAKQGGDRELNENDIFILNTVNHMREYETKNWKEIAAKIEGGYVFHDMSLASADVDTGKTPVQQFSRTMQLSEQLKESEERVIELDQALKEERNMRLADQERYLRELGDLREQIGGLKAELRIKEQGETGQGG